MIVIGMGGSHLAADLLKVIRPELDITVHSDYGIPKCKTNELVVLSSYSGNTEEVLDAYDKACNLNRAVITTGGQLLERAKKDGVCYIQMPDLGIQPRNAIIPNLKGLFELLGEKLVFDNFSPESFERQGKDLANKLKGKVPLIYTSNKNEPLGYTLKIKFNETGKIPAFNNVLPEANHNEINSFGLFKDFYGIFIKDSSDHSQVQKRMIITAKLYQDIGLSTEIVDLSAAEPLHKVLNFLAFADSLAFNTAKDYGFEPNEVPMIEKIKRLL